MKHLITISSLALLLAACGGTGADSTNPDAAAQEYTGTASLKSTPEFEFNTSTDSSFEFSQTQNRSTEGGVSFGFPGAGFMSICTEYSELEEDGEYDVNYDSCVLQAPVEDDSFLADIKVTNDVDSVIGVIWLKKSDDDETDPAPVYKVFPLKTSATVARRGTGPQALVW